MASGKSVVGVDVGGTNVRAAVFGPNCRQWLAPPVRRAVAEEADHVVDLVARTVRQAIEQANVGMEEIGAVGVGFPGIIDPQTGVSRFAVNLPRWTGGPLREWLEARLGLPVRVENDVRAGGLGEFLLGAGMGSGSMVYVSVGTGVGGALFLGGRAWPGATFQAGEIGHVVLDPSDEAPLCRCGQRGDAEALLSGRAIEETAQVLLASESTAGDVLEAGRDPDHPARELRERVTRYLMLLIANIQRLLDPERIVIGGGLGLHRAYPVEEAAAATGRAGLEFQAMPSVRRAALGPHSGLFGAALVAQGCDQE